MSHPVFAKEKPSHVGMTKEADSEIIKYLTFIELRTFPDVAHTQEYRVGQFCSLRLENNIFLCQCVLKMIHGTQAVLSPVHSRQAAEKIVTLFFIFKGHIMKIILIYCDYIFHIIPPYLSYGSHHRRISAP